MLLQAMEELDGGSVRKFRLEIPLPYSISLSNDQKRISRETLLKDKDVLDVTLGYSYVKGRSLLPKRRSKGLVVHRELEFRVDLKSLLDSTRH